MNPQMHIWGFTIRCAISNQESVLLEIHQQNSSYFYMPEQHSLKLLIDVLNHSPLATAIYDSSDLNIAFANEAMIAMWCSNPSIIGKPFSEAFPNFKEEGFSRILENVWQTGISYKAMDTPADILDGDFTHTRHFNFEYKALVDANNETFAILHTSIDVTAKNRALQMLKKQEQQLSINNDLEEITNSLAHDAKNPIAIARLAIDTLREDNKVDSDKRTQWYDIIDQAMVSLNTIIDKTVQLSEARAYSPEKTLIHVADKIKFWCEDAILLHDAPNTTIETGLLLPVLGDQGGIFQLFSNIISNAIKYSSSVREPSVQIYSEKTSKGVVYHIKDNGIGIPEQEIDEIYYNFQRGSNSSKHRGSGIGLFIAKRVIKRLDGQINISSKINVGTEVRLFFPNQS